MKSGFKYIAHQNKLMISKTKGTNTERQQLHSPHRTQHGSLRRVSETTGAAQRSQVQAVYQCG